MKKREETWDNLAKILGALANPTRLKILALCTEKERTSRELREILGISKPLLIAHLKVLINIGLLEYRTELDKEKFVIRKIYKTRDFEICIHKKELLRIMKEKINN